MADRFPLIVNEISKKIEEIVAGDKLELTGNGIVIGGDSGSGKYLTSDGSVVFWDSPGDVYLNEVQTLSNKTLTNSIISGASNTLSNIPNAALSNPSITINGSAVALGGSVLTPNDNTTYTIAAVDGLSASQKVIRLTAGGSGSGNDDVILAVGAPSSTPAGSLPISLELVRAGDTITFAGTAVNNDTITTIQSAVGGVAQSGAITIAAGGSSTVSQNPATKTITISSSYVDTVTELRATTGQVFSSGNFTFLGSGATSVAQGVDGNGDATITYSSTDTVTRIKGGAAGSFTSGDVTFTGGSNVTVSQAGGTVTIASVDTNTITRLASGSNTVAAGDFRIVAAGATSIAQTTDAGTGLTTITISSVNSDTGAALTASSGIILSSNDFQLKNASNFTGNTLLKWDSGNNQLANSLIQDNGSTVTIGGDLIVDGTQTILNTTTLQVEDNQIELRKGLNLVGSDGGLRLNRTTDAAGNVVSYQAIEWYESGGYWRSWDGSVDKRFVTETDTQVLTNKTLTSPTLTNPILGAASATSVNGLEITTTASAILSITAAKELDIRNDLVLTSDNNAAAITVNFRNGGNVAYRSDTLASFSTTTSSQLRGLISDTTGTNRLVFQSNPTILDSINTTSTAFTLLNASATGIVAFGAATAIDMGAAGGTFTINQNLVVNEDLTIGATASDNLICNGTFDSVNADILIRGGSSNPMKVGRGGGAVSSNTRVGFNTLENNSSGSQNTAYGFESSYANSSGAANTAIGVRVLRANSVGNNNVGVGRDTLISNTDGSKNIGVGNNALFSITSGDSNVCIGHYAGYGATGTGNVLIGPSDDENSTNATYAPPQPGGDRQLVIGSGTEAWIKGDAAFNLTLPNNLTVDGDATVSGNLTVNGTVTSINSNTLKVDDKEIELASVEATTFTAVCVDNSADITGITITVAGTGLIPGMEVNSTTGGISVPLGTVILSISGNTATLSNAVTGNGTATFTSPGATDLTADQGGIRILGTTDKRLYYDNSRTDKYWVSTENFEIAFGKKFVIGNQLALDTTTLGSTVVNSSLTSVGTLQNLTVSGFVTIGGVVTEKVLNNFSTTLTPSGTTLTINTAAANTVLGTPAASAINEWAFTSVGLSNGQSKTITVILNANTAATYGDACSVDGTSISNGVQWSGGSPPIASSNTDILTFVIITDNAGVTQVFGQGNTDFS